MKYKVGDKVRVRQWKAMEREFGLDVGGRIQTPNEVFNEVMSPYCGSVATIEHIGDDAYKVDVDRRMWFWTDDMFEGYAFEYGDEIEVRNHYEHRWNKRIYVGYVDGCSIPYVCVDLLSEEKFKNGKPFLICYWKNARPIPKDDKVKVVCEGKEVYLSRESAKALNLI